jgi:uncharacterized protein with NAD-binding domain and iron-sulfur cluster
MRRSRERVAILGGGMAGLAAAWRLSEPGWRDEFGSITVYQRGWRLGGKGASSRGANGRIEEHGLHVWLGWYENAFRLLRECYEELDRPARRPEAPVRTMSEAMFPSSEIGLTDVSGGTWMPWVTDLPANDRRPGDPRADGRDLTVVELVAQAFQLIGRYFDSLPDGGWPPNPSRARSFGTGVPVSIAALGAEAVRMTNPRAGFRGLPGGEVHQSTGPGEPLTDPSGRVDPLRRTWYGVALAVAAVRGMVADGLLTDPRGLRAINDEEYLSWLRRHGGPPELADYSIVRSLYDMVFGFVGGDPAHPSLSAGTAVLFGGKTLFDYRGSIFWKMAGGMGDIVFAPLYEALDRRGVSFEFFHRVDLLRPAKDGRRIGAIIVGRQAHLVPSRARYDPLVLSKGLPCFPSTPRVEQLSNADGVEGHPLESHWCTWPDAERRVLREGSDFDVVVFAIPPGMAAHTCAELAAERPEWRDMLDGLGTVATQAFQLWLGEADPDLGWQHPGSTLSSFKEPFSTWASMPHLIDAEEWPAEDRPGAVAYFCGALDAPSPTGASEAARQHTRVRDNAIEFLEGDIHRLLPGAAGDGGFRWDLLCGGRDRVGPDRFESQFWTANIDPSDRYVQSLPGTDRFRLRSDESGYDNLFLAGDWTDSGLNAGCIEAAVLSGLQAANAVRNRPRNHRIAGYFLP